MVDDLLQSLRDLAADLHAVGALLDRVLDLGGGFLRRLGAALGEVAHFVGHDREAHAGFAGAGRLDGRIEGEQVGLERDLIDRLDDLADAHRWTS